MENSKDALRQAVDLIKKLNVKKGTSLTEEEMARKLGISDQQMYAYLNGEAPTPAGLPFKLKSAYNLRTYIVEATQIQYVRDPKPAKDESARAESNRKSFESTITFIKKIGEGKGMNITDEELALKAGITTEQFYAYLRGEDKISDDLSSVLWSAYSSLITGVQKENNRESLKHTVVVIRNRGLSVGVNITVKEMARKIGIPEDVLYAYLNDEDDMLQDDLSHRLRLVYKDLLKDLKKVEIIEDINMIKIKNVFEG